RDDLVTGVQTCALPISAGHASTKKLTAQKKLTESTTERTTIMSTSTTNTIQLHRVLRATPEKIYRAFLDADAMAKWLPPNGFTRSEERRVGKECTYIRT